MSRPRLDLSPELPEVRSEDFNLFYRPETEPLPAGLETFARSLNAFVSDGMVDAYVIKEKKKKKKGEAEATKLWAETEANKKGFNQQVNSGKIPKEANPYFIDKYKELELNAKADAFKSKVYIEYGNKKVADNPDPEAFQKFYKNELKLYIKENQLGSFDAVELEKGFFKKTSAMKNQLFQAHVQTQMSVVGEQYKTNFINTIQGKFDSSKSFEDIGADISAFVKDAVKNSLSKQTAQQYILDTLTDYAENTGDYEYASKVLSELPQHIKLGTDSLGNVKGLKDDFDKIQEKLEDRADQELKDDNTRKENQRTKEALEAGEVVDKYETLTEAMKSSEWKNASTYKRNQIKQTYAGYDVGFSTETNPNIDSDINALLAKGDTAGAMELLNNSISEVQQTYFNNKKQEIKNYELSGTDGMLAISEFKTAMLRVQDLTKKAADAARNSSIKVGYDGMADEKFRIKAIDWLADNPVDNEPPRRYTHSKRRAEFEKFITEELRKEEEKIIGVIQGKHITGMENQEADKADKSKIEKKKTIGLDERRKIPKNIKIKEEEDADEGVIKNPKFKIDKTKIR